MKKFLDLSGLQRVMGNVSLRLDCKQDRLTGEPGHFVGFGEDGATALTISGGRNIALEQEGSTLTIHALEPRRNLLDNWYFASPVNQRGQEFYTGTGYTIDRWRSIKSCCLKLTGSGVEITQEVKNGLAMVQIFGAPLPEGTYTFSALVSDLSGTLRLNLRTSDGKSVGTISAVEPGLVSLTVTASQLHRAVLFPTEPGSTMTVVAVKLELGPVQTLARQDADGNWMLSDPPPDPALELAKCQRYYWASNGEYASSMVEPQGYLLCNVHFPVKMRAVPTVTIKSREGTLNMTGHWASGQDAVPANLNRNTLSQEGFNALYPLDRENAPFVGGNPYIFWVVADAEL